MRLSPWEMLSAVRKAVTRWVIEPASPQWGRNWNVFSPRSLCRDRGKCHVIQVLGSAVQSVELMSSTSSRSELKRKASCYIFSCRLVLLAWMNVQNLLAQVVEHHDVGVHVEQVVSVRWVVLWCPHLGLWAFVREHVVAVFGLIIHAVKPSHLAHNMYILLHVCIFSSSSKIWSSAHTLPFAQRKVWLHLKSLLFGKYFSHCTRYLHILGRHVWLCAFVDWQLPQRVAGKHSPASWHSVVLISLTWRCHCKTKG